MESFLNQLAFIASTFVAVFVIVDPFAVIPIFLSITEGNSKGEREAACTKAALVAMGILTAFALLGTKLFGIFGISLEAFQIGGGILLLMLGIAQLSADRRRVKAEEAKEAEERDDVSVFPLAIPLLAGPGAISTVVLMSSKGDDIIDLVSLVAAIGGAIVASYLLLRSAPAIQKALGKTGLNILTRLMGLMLVAIAVQFIINGIKSAFNIH